MKTRFRITTILFVPGLLGVVATIPVFILYHDIDNLGQLETGVIVFLVLFSSLFVAGIIGLIWFTLRINIDLTADRILFHYPFRFQKFQYKANEVLGFRYKYLHGRVNYKSLKFMTSDKRIFSISDFETGNLRDFESLSLKHFDLRAGKEFNTLTDKQKEIEIEISKAFDYEQVKDIRFYLGMLVVILTVVISFAGYKVLSGQVAKPGGILIAIGILSIIEMLTINQFLKIHKRVKNW